MQGLRSRNASSMYAVYPKSTAESSSSQLNGHKLAVCPSFMRTLSRLGGRIDRKTWKITSKGYYLVISKFALIKGIPQKISRNVKSHWFPVVSFVFLWGTTYQWPQESRSPKWICWELLQSWALPSTSWPSWLFWHPGDGGISTDLAMIYVIGDLLDYSWEYFF